MIRILLIDNEPNWIKFAQNDLSNDVFEIVVAADLETAVEELEDDKFDLVIASSRRLDVLEIIRERFKEKQVVITTINPSMQERLVSYELGAKGYFAKSYGAQDLLNRVKEIVPVSPNAII